MKRITPLMFALFVTFLLFLAACANSSPVDSTIKGATMDTPSLVDNNTLLPGKSITLIGENGEVSITNTDGQVVLSATIPDNDRIGNLNTTHNPTQDAYEIRWFTDADHTATAGINLTATGDNGVLVEWTEGLEKKEQ